MHLKHLTSCNPPFQRRAVLYPPLVETRGYKMLDVVTSLFLSQYFKRKVRVRVSRTWAFISPCFFFDTKIVTEPICLTIMSLCTHITLSTSSFCLLILPFAERNSTSYSKNVKSSFLSLEKQKLNLNCLPKFRKEKTKLKKQLPKFRK